MSKKILSFDGGGIRGVISVIFLLELQKETGLNLAEKADLIAGTSTGSIIAGSLAAGLSAEAILAFYQHKSTDIFKPGHHLDQLLGIEAKYSSQSLYDAIDTAYTSQGMDPQMPLSALPKKVVFPTINLDNKVLHRWRLELLNNLNDENSSTKLIDAMMSSTAAPTYFPSYQGCIDGGMGANDPSAVAYSAFVNTYNAPSDLCLLSIGTGFTDNNIPKGEAWGTLSWIVNLDPKSKATKTPLLSMLFDVQDQLPSQMCQLILQENYQRINLKLSEAVKLDNVKKIPELIEWTYAYIQNNPEEWRQTCNWVSSNFGS